MPAEGYTVGLNDFNAQQAISAHLISPHHGSLPRKQAVLYQRLAAVIKSPSSDPG